MDNAVSTGRTLSPSHAAERLCCRLACMLSLSSRPGIQI